MKRNEIYKSLFNSKIDEEGYSEVLTAYNNKYVYSMNLYKVPGLGSKLSLSRFEINGAKFGQIELIEENNIDNVLDSIENYNFVWAKEILENNVSVIDLMKKYNEANNR